MVQTQSFQQWVHTIEGPCNLSVTSGGTFEEAAASSKRGRKWLFRSRWKLSLGFLYDNEAVHWYIADRRKPTSWFAHVLVSDVHVWCKSLFLRMMRSRTSKGSPYSLVAKFPSQNGERSEPTCFDRDLLLLVTVKKVLAGQMSLLIATFYIKKRKQESPIDWHCGRPCTLLYCVGWGLLVRPPPKKKAKMRLPRRHSIIWPTSSFLQDEFPTIT